MTAAIRGSGIATTAVVCLATGPGPGAPERPADSQLPNTPESGYPPGGTGQPQGTEGNRRIHMLIWLGAVVLVFLVASRFAVRPYYIPSYGMSPTLAVNDRVMVNLLAYRVGDPKRGDLVVFRAPNAEPGGRGKVWIKRLIGLPGDTIEVRSYDGVYVDGRKLEEPYIGPAQTPNYDYGPKRVPARSYFVLGDNRRDSNDSHVWGMLPRSHLKGKVWLRFWPPDRFGVIR